MSPGPIHRQKAPPTLPHIEAQKAARDRHSPRAPLAADPAERRVYRLRTPKHVEASPGIRAALDDEQLAAVEQGSGRCLVLAAAGSGKTRVIVHRLAHVALTGTPPSDVLLATFTRRAAAEMTTRAGTVCGRDLSALRSGTFHAICNALLRKHGAAVGLANDFTILDGEDQGDLIAVCRDHALGGRSERQSLPKPSVLANEFAIAAELGRDGASHVVERNPRLVDRTELLEAIAARYAARKRALNVVDYADLIVLADRLLTEHPAVRERVASGLGGVLVDEFHDVNVLQVRISESLASVHGNLMVVGDPDQAIYGWRGAAPDTVARFAEHPDTRVFKLQGNYRSTPEIVGLAQAFLPGGNRFGRTLRATRPPVGSAPVVAHCASVAEEAAFVVQRIADLMNEGRDPGEIAVLYRAHHHSLDVQLALAASGVEFEVFSGARFVESAHVKDAVAFLRLRQNRRDELAWRRALSRFERIGPATIGRALAAIDVGEDPLDALTAAHTRGPLAAPLERAREAIGSALALDRPEDIIRFVVGADWYRAHLERAYPNWRDREADLARLAELAARATSLDTFLSDLQLAERVEVDEDISGPARHVSLSSVHQAKGLEWPVVFVLNVESGAFPSGWAVSEGNLEEEERLFYVAITRARDELYLCRPIAADRPWDTGAKRIVLNSGQGFLDRDLAGLVEEWSVRG
ncbi:MAG: ATP-dependent helicase [Actinobacteria bacterium]|nr:ATP-dependent helicase [Actinomycetota bacterium]